VLLAIGCGRSPQHPEPHAPRADTPWFEEPAYAAEMEGERQDFIAKTDERLGELDRDIGWLEARIDDSTSGITEPERRQTKQDLVGLRIQAAKTGDQLEHAWASSPDEWQALRETIARDLTQLETRIATIAGRFETRVDDHELDGEREPTGGRDPGGR
jgi:hypothetical protein